jgi:hypothetical protein
MRPLRDIKNIATPMPIQRDAGFCAIFSPTGHAISKKPAKIREIQLIVTCPLTQILVNNGDEPKNPPRGGLN